MRSRPFLLTALLGILLIPGCQCGPTPTNNPSVAAEPAKPTLTGEALVQRGETVYKTNCIACHGANPSQPGSIGPEILGSGHDLIEARVLRAEYPQGYLPKRQTHAMTAMPYLKDDIDALAAYLGKK